MTGKVRRDMKMIIFGGYFCYATEPVSRIDSQSQSGRVDRCLFSLASYKIALAVPDSKNTHTSALKTHLKGISTSFA
jgi:hypothetical protein